MFTKRSVRDLSRGLKNLITAPNMVCSFLAAIVAVSFVMIAVLLFERSAGSRVDVAAEEQDSSVDFVYFDLRPQTDTIGIGGQGRVGFNDGSGEGSAPKLKPARGGGGGGDRTPLPEQTGKVPPPSDVFAAIPTRPPVNPPALPLAGIDFDPALWKDLKAPVYGNPTSVSEMESKGPGEGDGMGTGNGLGIGEGDGPGYGRGKDGNIGGDSRGIGGGGGGGAGGVGGRVLRSNDVEQKARLLSKPEPKYTEEARRNNISGTVMLRAVFASSGEVVQIRALNALPFGLTERAIAAAREIKFEPAKKDGRPVSVAMQLEYNFNLY